MAAGREYLTYTSNGREGLTWLGLVMMALCIDDAPVTTAELAARIVGSKKIEHRTPVQAAVSASLRRLVDSRRVVKKDGRYSAAGPARQQYEGMFDRLASRPLRKLTDSKLV